MDTMNLRNYAYIGDAVWELFVREKTILITGNSKKLHEITTAKVNARFQCLMYNLIEDVLTEDEKDIARRGRNMQIPVGRRINQGEYRQATAFETLIGWWYENDKERLNQILTIINEKIEF